MFKVDLHVHTKDVSPCGRVFAEKLVLEYKKAGYDAIVICDHFSKAVFDRIGGLRWKTKVRNFLEGYKKAKIAGEKAGLEVYLGMELRTAVNKNDFLIYGADEQFLYDNPNLFMKSLEEIKEIIDNNNLLMIQAHPFRPMCEAVDKELVHGREIFNGHFNHTSNNELSEKLCKEDGGIATSGSDAHYFCDIGNGGVIFEEKPENIADSLRKGNYSVIKTEPQWANILFARNADENNLKIARAFYELDAVIDFSESGIFARKINGEEIEMVNGILTVNRCQVVCGSENLKNAVLTEPVILLEEEVCDNIKGMLEEMGAILSVTVKSDDERPYKEGLINYIGFDMLGDVGMFVADIMGPSVKLEKIEL